MNRWKNAFQNDPFQQTFKEILDISRKLDTISIIDMVEIEECSRFIKVIAYTDGLLKSSNPEMVPFIAWQQLRDHANNCLSEIRQYSSNKNILNIANANNYIDNIMVLIRNYTITNDKSIESTIDAINIYNNTIDLQIESVRRAAQSTIDTMESNNKKMAATLAGC